MNYSSKSLAVKYRPQTFDEIVGQSTITDILKNQIQTKTFRNAVLFTGPAGCGKTTSARAFASLLNNGKGRPIEIDAASNNSVDNVRDIITKAQQKSLDSEYKVFIIDECFAPNTLITMMDGVKQIKDVKVGDYIQNAVGYGKVTQVNCNRVLTNRLCCVKINGVETFTTVDHLFFTNNGWVSAKNLKAGDIVYANVQVQKLWNRILQKTDESSLRILFKAMRTELSKEEIFSKSEDLDKVLHNMWETVLGDWKDFSESDVLKRMSKQIDNTEVCGFNADRTRETDSATVIFTNETKQPKQKSIGVRESKTDENEKWDTARVDGASWWQRRIYEAAINALSSVEYASEVRVCNSHKIAERQRISYMLQSRPRLSRNEACDRGGWQWASMEKWLVERLEEDKFSEQFRVDSVEIYQQGNNDELFQRGFDNQNLDSGELQLYDLTIDTHPSYFANGILVHNCHSISNAGWQAFLKLIEEPPVSTVFLFCTTDPQKIPATIISRVQRFEFKRISFENIVKRLEYILAQEGYKQYELAAVQYIAKMAAGGMRDAITTLDKCLAFSAELTLQNVVKAIGSVDYSVYFDLTNAIIDYKEKVVIDIIENCYRDGSDLKQFVKNYTAFLLDVCKYCICQDFEYIQIPDTYEKDLKYLIDEKQFLKYLLKEINVLNSEIKWEASVKSIVELKLLALTQPENSK